MAKMGGTRDNIPPQVTPLKNNKQIHKQIYIVMYANLS